MFPSLGFPTLHFFLAFLWLFFCQVSCLFSAPSLMFLLFWLVSGRSSASVESPVPSATGSSLWAEAVTLWVFCAPSPSLSCTCFIGSFAVIAFCFSPSLLLVLLPSSCGSFLFGGQSSSSSMEFFRLSTFFVLLWFFLKVVWLGLSSALFSISTSFQRFIPGVVLVAFPSFSCLGWVLFLCVYSP